VGNLDKLIINIFMFLFSKHRHLLFTTFNVLEYYKMVDKLKSNGLSYRTRITSLDTGDIGSSRDDLSQYDILIKKQDKHIASKIINS
jgi:hypothetical protein